ncbi:uncharacterized protein LOC114523752 [Dendronephthya gigantea]|uniref:uncharacterized protein LOC114523752 n=1 Tax=Dendronephthya gigantea TaxID=151771 RepID=UPI00106A027A|nr:uncharacterized protein LOC114523752 [Dendronephthya gigantea]
MAAKKTSREAEDLGNHGNKVVKSKRRLRDDCEKELSQVDCKLKEVLAKELSDYLDRTLEEVQVCGGLPCINFVEEDDFQLFSSHRQPSSTAIVDEKQKCLIQDTRADMSDSSSSEDDETTARLKEAAVSAKDILGLTFNCDQKSV